MNSTIREFEEGLVLYINQFNLPIEVKRLIIKDVFYQVDKIATDTINQELLMKKELEAKESQEKQDIIVEEVTD